MSIVFGSPEALAILEADAKKRREEAAAKEAASLRKFAVTITYEQEIEYTVMAHDKDEALEMARNGDCDEGEESDPVEWCSSVRSLT